MDNQSIIEEIKRIVRIEDVVSEHVILQPAGRRLKARCPFHEEKTPSFYVNPELGLFKCFGCGLGGDVFEFLMKIERITFPEAGERLAERAGLRWHVHRGDEAAAKRRQLARKANEVAVQHFEAVLHSPQGKPGLDYLLGRGFSDEIVRRFRLGYAPDAWDGLLRHLQQKGIDAGIAAEAGLAKERPSGGHYDVFRARVMFPITDVGNRVIGFGGRALDPENPAKYLNTADTAMFKKGQHVYALNMAHKHITKAKQAVLVEGYTDVLALHQAGIDNVVACLGTALTQDHLNLLSRSAEEIILAYDADAAGMSAAARNIPMLEACASQVKIAVLPAGLDPDECVKTHGPEGFQRVVENCTTPVEYEIDLVFSQHQDRGPDGVTRAAQKVVDIVLRVADRARQDEFLARAADRWGQGSPGRTEAMQGSLRQELRRRLSGRSAVRDDSGVSPRDRRYIVEGVSRLAAEVPPWVARAERELLTLAVSSRSHAQKLLAHIAPEQFFLPPHRALAQAIAAQLTDETHYSQSAVLGQLPEDNPAHELAIALTFEDPPEGEQEVVASTIANLNRYRETGGYRATYEVRAAQNETDVEPVEDFEVLRRRVIEKLNSGNYDPEDPDIQLYMSCTARTHGTGNAGMHT